MADRPTYDELVARLQAVEQRFERDELRIAAVPFTKLTKKLENQWTPNTNWLPETLPRFFGPYTTGAITVPAAGGLAVDVPVATEVLNAPANRVIMGIPDGTTGAYDWVHFAVGQTVITAGNLRVFFINTHPTIPANLTFRFLVYI